MGSHWPERIAVVDAASVPLNGDVLLPFAFEEYYGRKVEQGAIPLLHVWRHKKAFVLGLRDRMLPRVRDAVRWLEERGYAVAVRHSGGAAVPLDEGVVNVSLILPKEPGRTDLHADFTRMADLLKAAVAPYAANVAAGEIAGAYCPGAYDLSVGGRKFCGISQRRLARAQIVQAFVNVAGAGFLRAQTARQFYERAAGRVGADEGGYPQVSLESMTSLAEDTLLSGTEEFVAAVKKQLSLQGVTLVPASGYDPDTPEIRETIVLLRERYGLG
jgi:octanoyl-[GcvH]:protein N-octanoyltransferase